MTQAAMLAIQHLQHIARPQAPLEQRFDDYHNGPPLQRRRTSRDHPEWQIHRNLAEDAKVLQHHLIDGLFLTAQSIPQLLSIRRNARWCTQTRTGCTSHVLLAYSEDHCVDLLLCPIESSQVMPCIVKESLGWRRWRAKLFQRIDAALDQRLHATRRLLYYVPTDGQTKLFGPVSSDVAMPSSST